MKTLIALIKEGWSFYKRMLLFQIAVVGVAFVVISIFSIILIILDK